MNTQKVIVQVYEHLAIELNINKERTGYSFKTPKCFGGRHYYQFCNDVYNSFEQQFPQLEIELRINQRGIPQTAIS
jgi:hypothetical protein